MTKIMETVGRNKPLRSHRLVCHQEIADFATGKKAKLGVPDIYDVWGVSGTMQNLQGHV